METNGSGTVTGSHICTAPGVYTIKQTVTDKDGGQGESTFEYVVVYDPEGGFVTGGGWIDSTAGVHTVDPSLTGKASFGFVSKYNNGAIVPTGQTEFQFKVADLDFHSNTYDWLVIAGAKAMCKGTINGEGEYRFLLSAIDADINENDSIAVDRFRIKIWETVSQEVIYDNQQGAADDVDPATEIGGGSIVIHKAE